MNQEHNFQKTNVLFGFHKCIYCSKINVLKSIYKCVDCDDYCHRVCYKESTNLTENDQNKTINIPNNQKQDVNQCVVKEHQIPNKKHRSKETIIEGFVQPLAVMYSTFMRRRCTIDRVLEALYKLFPEVAHPPYNGFFFGNSNNATRENKTIDKN
ncbi:Uncharacterized protein FWK35_00023618 [Aphis craccivora]|uniref:Phorbol-ester/DAG-type domain-containing protein n=1 Tax=Aphis craccivora TaxID=307492 RepID=A0A6G0YIE6_APHCR|nr:Uncharacterized protein FWK35_00022144 [Aphis craccivora]KAF0758572.1 Uncharacterized protein FWK35_00026205 [Aphis craccivora]KAF0758573.1 Uncharacterized protein FWK35_00023618 [Aphis craccivora]